MKQYKWDVFSKQVPKTFFRSFLKWLSHFNVSTKIKVILYPVYFAHSAISRVEIEASVNFAKLIRIYSRSHSFILISKIKWIQREFGPTAFVSTAGRGAKGLHVSIKKKAVEW